MLANFKKLVLGLAALSLAACSSGGGGSGNSSVGGGIYYTHAQLAQKFEDAMWYDLGYDVELVKINTLQYNYVVVYDYDLGTYDAYDLTNYNPGENIGRFLDTNEWRFYYDLIPVGNNIYEDPWTGTLFEKTEGTAKDRMKLAAAKEHLAIKAVAANLSANYGLSAERAQEVGKTIYMLKQTPKDRMTDADYDRFALAITGSTMDQIKSAAEKMASGDRSELNRVIEAAAQTNSLTPEDANAIVENIISGQIN